MKRFAVGPCLVCGGRALKSGRRRHHAEAHAKHTAARKATCLAPLLGTKAKNWPRLLGCGKFQPPARPRTAATEWLCKVLKSGEVVHFAAGNPKGA